MILKLLYELNWLTLRIGWVESYSYASGTFSRSSHYVTIVYLNKKSGETRLREKRM